MPKVTFEMESVTVEIPDGQTIWHAARKALPALDAQITQGEFAPLLDWLRANVHRYGRKYLPGELTQHLVHHWATAIAAGLPH